MAPDRQGQGLGTKLLCEVERCLAVHTEAVELFTGEHSTANLRLYRRLGYRETVRSPAGHYDLVHLRKHLHGPVPAAAWTARRADPVHDLRTVVALLDERARWLHERGLTGQWPLDWEFRAPGTRRGHQPGAERGAAPAAVAATVAAGLAVAGGVGGHAVSVGKRGARHLPCSSPPPEAVPGAVPNRPAR